MIMALKSYPFLLHLAAYDGDEDLVAVLLKRKDIKVNRTVSGISFIEDDETPLHIAAERGHDKVVDLLLDHKDRLEGLS